MRARADFLPSFVVRLYGFRQIRESVGDGGRPAVVAEAFFVVGPWYKKQIYDS